MRLSDKTLQEIAFAIEPRLASHLEENGGMLPDHVLTMLAKQHARHAIVSERSLRKVHEYLCSM